MTNRRHIKHDPYAWSDVVRDHRLTTVQQAVLLHLRDFASFRSEVWTGTTTELATAARVSRNSVLPAIHKLQADGLIEVLDRPGPNRSAAVLVCCYGTVVVPERKAGRGVTSAQNSATGGTGNRAATAQHSRTKRAANAQDSADELGEPRGARRRGCEGGMGGAERSARDTQLFDENERESSWNERPFGSDEPWETIGPGTNRSERRTAGGGL